MRKGAVAYWLHTGALSLTDHETTAGVGSIPGGSVKEFLPALTTDSVSVARMTTYNGGPVFIGIVYVDVNFKNSMRTICTLAVTTLIVISNSL